MKLKRPNLTWRTRRRLKTAGLILGGTAALGFLVWLCWVLWLGRFVVYSREAVLIDFDASRIVKAEHDADTVILGTVGFAAPEQYGLSQSDERADIYSLGVLLNVMLTGKHPSKKLVSGKMGRIVRRCTMVNPKERYQNVHSLMRAL